MRARLDIVYLSCCEKWWDWERNGFVSRPARIAQGLAEHEAVRNLLVIDAPSSVGRWAARRAARKEPPPSGLSDAGGKVHVLDEIRLLPKERSWPFAYRLNGRMHEERSSGALARAMSDLGMERPVLWLTGPLVARDALPFADNLVVYDAMDEWKALPEMAAMRDQIDESYDTILSVADIVFAVSPTLVATFSGGRPDVHLVPNGVDAERFSAPLAVPSDIAALPRPVVGYVGMLQDRVDVGLVARLARRLPHVSFAFVGPVLDRNHFEVLQTVPNVHFLGPRPASVVPACIAGFDACFLPHVDSDLTRNMDPLKLYEYIAAGKRTVATDLPMSQPEELVRRAPDDESFAAALEAAFDGSWPLPDDVRKSHLDASSWTARIDTMVERVLVSDQSRRTRALLEA
jgi:glycosyltransferase involved in cell wall biosynthesis